MKDSPLANVYRKLLRNPKYRWLILGASAVYLLSPIDISPDVIPIVGWIDDGVVATFLAAEVTQIILERRQKMKQSKTGVAPDPASSESAVPGNQKS
ncbi:MAG: DUF1232 domain-containing protein [Oscillatoriales cyanobacterium RM2_1_1]|nr:DUF1232 domain-containing protein [Oscillatoriales cyanobacterium SM2_3_0]NJO47227.1 DUF1232 domain-containing protein [Oscillatoriales cyanobacterium RM2_1_1]